VPGRQEVERPLVSVVVPTYNHAAFLPDALRSVQAQTYDRWECIVVDDGSTDDTAGVVSALSTDDPRVRYVHQDNQGLASARNTGLDLVSGSLIQMLDADDLIEPDKIRVQSARLAEQPETDIVYGEAWYFQTPTPEIRLPSPFNLDWMPRISGRGDAVIAQLLRNNIMPVSAPLVRRSVFERIGRFSVRLRAVEDWEFWLRCAIGGCHFEFLNAPRTSTLIRFHPGSMSGNHALMLSTELEVHRATRSRLESRALRRLSVQMEAEVSARLAVREALAGHSTQAMRRMLRAGLARPRLRWLLLAAALPILRLGPARRLVRRWRPGIRYEER
jgi:GT2 family glycosyltransferase